MQVVRWYTILACTLNMVLLAQKDPSSNSDVAKWFESIAEIIKTQGSKAAVPFLPKEVAQYTCPNTQKTLLDVAVEYGALSLVQSLIGLGSKVSAKLIDRADEGIENYKGIKKVLTNTFVPEYKARLVIFKNLSLSPASPTV